MDSSKIKIHVLHCGSMLVSRAVTEGGGINLKNARRAVFDSTADRVELPVSAYLIEHPKGLILVDTGWSRDISPDGVYDKAAVRRNMPAYLARFYHPQVEKGKTVFEQLSAMGICPGDISTLILTHFDADHVSALQSMAGAKRIIAPEEEKWWSIRTVYKLRQPELMRRNVPIEYFWFKGTMEGPLWWSYDLFGDESVTLVCLPGHTDGHIGLKIKNGKKFAVLTSDAAFSERSWREKIMPGFGFNEKAILKSFDWITEQTADPDCIAVISNHDPEVKPQVITL